MIVEQIIVAAIVGGLASGFGAFIGVRIALARVETKLAAHEKDIEDHADRLKWLERKG